MSDQQPRGDNPPEREREVVVSNGGSGSNLGVGILIGVLVVAIVVALFVFLGADGDDGGIDVPDTLELDVEVDNGNDGGGDDGDGGDDDGGGEEG